MITGDIVRRDWGVLARLCPATLRLVLFGRAATAGAAMSIAQTGLPGGQQAGVLAVFIVLGTVKVAAPLVAHLARGRKADSMLNGWHEWLTASNPAIMLVLFLVFGFVLIGQRRPVLR